jgi:hypothetical protein
MRSSEIEGASAQSMTRGPNIGALIAIAVAVVVAFVVISFVSKMRYLTELEPPAQYNHPYHGPVVERVMPVAEVRTLCTSVGASGPLVACAWVSNGACHIVLPNNEPAPVSLTAGTKLPIATVGPQIIPTVAKAIACN